MHPIRSFALALGLSLGLLGTVACDGGADRSPEPASSEMAGDSRRATEQRVVESEPSMCDLLDVAEVDAALGGKLPLGPAESIGQGCKFPIRFGTDGNGLSFSRLSRGNYDAYRGYESQSSVAFEFLEGLGQEAFILNNAQVCVLLGEDEALIVVAQVMAFKEELPITPEELKQALIKIAEMVVSQL